MCDLCSKDPETVQGAKDLLEINATVFRAFSDTLREMARGEIGPHSIEVETHIKPFARGMLRYLATDWI